jgi:hypothetical protein
MRLLAKDMPDSGSRQAALSPSTICPSKAFRIFVTISAERFSVTSVASSPTTPSIRNVVDPVT